MKQIMTLILALLWTVSVAQTAQPKKESAILARIRQSKPDTNKVRAYIDWMDYWAFKSADSVNTYLDSVRILSQKLSYLPGQLAYYRHLILGFWAKGQNQQMLQAGRQLIAFSRTVNDQNGKITGLLTVAVAQNSLGHLQESLETYLRVLSIIEKAGLGHKHPQVYSGLASVFHNTGDFDKALSYSKTYVAICQKNADSLNLPTAYYNLAESLAIVSRLDSAIIYYHKGAAMADVVGDTQLKAASLAGLSIAHSKIHQPKKGLPYAKAALAMSQKIGFTHAVINSYVGLCRNYFAMNDLTKAASFGEKAIHEIESVHFEHDFVKEYELLASVNRQTGNYKKAYEYQTTFYALKEKIASGQIKIKIQQLETSYQTIQKEKQILLLQKDKKVQASLIGSLRDGITAGLVGFCCLSLIGFLAYRNVMIRKEIAEKEVQHLHKEHQLIATNLMLKSQDEERTRFARDLHDGLGGLLAGIKFKLLTLKDNVALTEANAGVFSYSLTQLDRAISEMRRVAHSMMPEALAKFGLQEALQDFCEGITQTGQLTVNFQAFGIDKRFDPAIENALYRIVQELIHNVLKHAQATEAYVQLTCDGNQLTLTVEDNGKGFDTQTVTPNKGAGMRNIESRVAYLNGKIDIQSGPDEGTSVLIEMTIS